MSNNDTAPAAQADSGFSWDADVKPYLESQTIRGGFVAVAGSLIGIVFGASAATAAVEAANVWQIVQGAAGLVGGGIALYGSIHAIIGRFRAIKRIV